MLIIGATGFLGGALARRFCERGDRVVGLGRGDGRVARLSEVRDEIEWFDLARDGVGAAFTRDRRFDAVLFTAASYGRRGETLEQVIRVNTLLPLTVLEAAVQAGCGTFVYANTALHNVPNAYSLSKRQFAEWGRLLVERRPLCFLDLRLEHMYGPGDDESKFPALVIGTLLRNEPALALTPGDQRRDFVFIDDVADACERLLASAPDLGPGCHEVPIGSGHSVSVREFVTLVKELTGSSTRLDFGALDYRPHEVMQSEAELGTMMALGWAPATSLRDGLCRTIDEERRR